MKCWVWKMEVMKKTTERKPTTKWMLKNRLMRMKILQADENENITIHVSPNYYVNDNSCQGIYLRPNDAGWSNKISEYCDSLAWTKTKKCDFDH